LPADTAITPPQWGVNNKSPAKIAGDLLLIKIPYSLTRFRRRLLLTTNTLLKAIAPAASTGTR